MTDTTSPVLLWPAPRVAATVQFDEMVRLLSGRVVAASVVARLEPDRGPTGPFMNVKVEHVECLDSVRLVGDRFMAEGDDLMNRLANDELLRLTRVAERTHFSRVTQAQERSQPMQERF